MYQAVGEYVLITDQQRFLKVSGVRVTRRWWRFYINVWHCGGLFVVLLQLIDPLELFVKTKESIPGSGFLSRRDMT